MRKLLLLTILTMLMTFSLASSYDNTVTADQMTLTSETIGTGSAVNGTLSNIWDGDNTTIYTHYYKDGGGTNRFNYTIPLGTTNLTYPTRKLNVTYYAKNTCGALMSLHVDSYCYSQFGYFDFSSFIIDIADGFDGFGYQSENLLSDCVFDGSGNGFQENIQAQLRGVNFDAATDCFEFGYSDITFDYVSPAYNGASVDACDDANVSTVCYCDENLTSWESNACYVNDTDTLTLQSDNNQIWPNSIHLNAGATFDGNGHSLNGQVNASYNLFIPEGDNIAIKNLALDYTTATGNIYFIERYANGFTGLNIDNVTTTTKSRNYFLQLFTYDNIIVNNSVIGGQYIYYSDAVGSDNIQFLNTVINPVLTVTPFFIGNRQNNVYFENVNISQSGTSNTYFFDIKEPISTVVFVNTNIDTNGRNAFLLQDDLAYQVLLSLTDSYVNGRFTTDANANSLQHKITLNNVTLDGDGNDLLAATDTELYINGVTLQNDYYIRLNEDSHVFQTYQEGNIDYLFGDNQTTMSYNVSTTNNELYYDLAGASGGTIVKSTNISIADNWVYAMNNSYFDKKATITFNNINSTYDVPYKDGSLCGAACLNVDNNGNRLQFNVTGFSNYSWKMYPQTPPIILSYYPTTNQVDQELGNSQQFRIESYFEDNNDTISYAWYVNGVNNNTNNSVFDVNTTTFCNDDCTLTIKGYVIDKDGNDSQTWTLNVYTGYNPSYDEDDLGSIAIDGGAKGLVQLVKLAPLFGLVAAIMIGLAIVTILLESKVKGGKK